MYSVKNKINIGLKMPECLQISGENSEPIPIKISEYLCQRMSRSTVTLTNIDLKLRRKKFLQLPKKLILASPRQRLELPLQNEHVLY